MIAILGAMPQEVQLIASSLEACHEVDLVGRRFLSGRLRGREVLVAFSRWGKVAAAATVSAAITRFPVEAVVFTGVAGGLNPSCRVGDVVVGKTLVQHDLDARPLFERFEIPLSGIRYIEANVAMQQALVRAVRRFVERGLEDLAGDLAAFGVTRPALHEGLIASGDRFVADAAVSRELKAALPSALCVEMEGAAVAQVCVESKVPFGVVRTISDAADHGSPVDFPKFLEALASHFSLGILLEFLAEPPVFER
jgi:adenosylhomocysteine nucleosidase